MMPGAFLFQPHFKGGGLKAGNFIPNVECKWCDRDCPISPFWKIIIKGLLKVLEAEK